MRYVSSLLLLTVAIALMSLIGCGKQETTDIRRRKIDPKLVPYIKRFYAEAQARNVTSFPQKLGNVTLEAMDKEIEQGKSGFCYSRNHDVVISRTFFENATDQMREQLIFHELGHCVLNRNHDDGAVEALIPLDEDNIYSIPTESSLMSQKLSDTAYPHYRDEYLDAFFQNRPVDLKKAFIKNNPKLLNILEERKTKLEKLVNRMAELGGELLPLIVEISENEIKLDEGKFLIPYPMLSSGAAFYALLLKEKIADEKQVKKFEEKMRDCCKSNPTDDLCGT